MYRYAGGYAPRDAPLQTETAPCGLAHPKRMDAQRPAEGAHAALQPNPCLEGAGLRTFAAASAGRRRAPPWQRRSRPAPPRPSPPSHVHASPAAAGRKHT